MVLDVILLEPCEPAKIIHEIKLDRSTAWCKKSEQLTWKYIRNWKKENPGYKIVRASVSITQGHGVVQDVLEQLTKYFFADFSWISKHVWKQQKSIIKIIPAGCRPQSEFLESKQLFVWYCGLIFLLISPRHQNPSWNLQWQRFKITSMVKQSSMILKMKGQRL